MEARAIHTEINICSIETTPIYYLHLIVLQLAILPFFGRDQDTLAVDKLISRWRRQVEFSSRNKVYFILNKTSSPWKQRVTYIKEIASQLAIY